MKIIKHGFRKPPKPPEPVVYKEKCIRCGCFFEYVIEDEEFDWFGEYEEIKNEIVLITRKEND